MRKLLLFIKDRFFGRHLEFRVRLFNVLAMAGALIGACMCVVGILNYSGIVTVIANAAATVLSLSLMQYCYRSGRYQFCYMVTIIVVFLALFPALFFSSGGYLGGMPSFFVFAVLFTVFMLEGKKAIVFAISELLFYLSLCVIVYFHPEWVNSFENEREIFTDIMVSIVTVSTVLGICLYLHFRMYNEQQKKLNEQNAILEQTNRMKTEFLANTSHEMRTPLTVISVNVQTVSEILEDMGDKIDDPEAVLMLKNAQGEIMRLSRMVGGMLTLASMSESTDRQKLDLTALIQSGTEMLRLSLDKHGNKVTVDIESKLYVYGNADLLAQVLANILQNAGTHTQNGEIAITAKKMGNVINVIIKDTGTGISPDILPNIFDRGVSTDGTGYGLYLSKTVIDSHGGKIWVESEQGKGTTATFQLPFYEGQFGGA